MDIVLRQSGLHILKHIKTNENISFARIVEKDSVQEKGEEKWCFGSWGADCSRIRSMWSEVLKCSQRREDERHIWRERSSMKAMCEDEDVRNEGWQDVVMDSIPVSTFEENK